MSKIWSWICLGNKFIDEWGTHLIYIYLCFISESSEGKVKIVYFCFSEKCSLKFSLLLQECLQKVGRRLFFQNYLFLTKSQLHSCLTKEIQCAKKTISQGKQRNHTLDSHAAYSCQIPKTRKLQHLIEMQRNLCLLLIFQRFCHSNRVFITPWITRIWHLHRFLYLEALGP